MALFLAWLGVAAVVSAAGASSVFLANDGYRISFGNLFVQAVVNSQTNELEALFGDFYGTGNFTTNVLSKPFRLEDASGRSVERKALACSATLSPTKDSVSVTSKVMVGDVEEDWTFLVTESSRSVSLNLAGRVVADVTTTSLSYDLFLAAPSLYGLFDTGTVQMMGHSAACLGSEDALSRAYFLGDGSALDVVLRSPVRGVVFRSDAAGKDGYHSALELLVAGAKYPRISKSYYGAWSPQCWSGAAAVTVPAGTTWAIDVALLPNNGNFPVYSVRDVLDASNMGDATQLATHLLGVYPSAVGCLQSYYDKQRGIVAPTVSHPDVGYSPDTNFFDPDNFLTLSAMLYAADPALLRELRDVLERTAETMCGIGSDQDAHYCSQPRQRLRHQPYVTQRHRVVDSTATSGRKGQLMHHFVSLAPTYESIAGSEQLGPNIFWTLMALRYVSLSQDRSWALHYFPYIDLSSRFILSFVDQHSALVDAPGPLWIDVLVRENYTSDSAAMLVAALPQLADYYDLVAALDATEQSLAPTASLRDTAREMRALAERVAAAMRAQLWAADDDHFVTQRNKDGSVRDFVDYDANLLAVAAGVLQNDEAAERRLLTRVDRGNYTHVRATWCSELPYTGDACDCYIVGGSVCGDSVVTLARIGWVDALARHRVGDVDTFQRLLLQPLQRDLLQYTWLYERYDANGQQTRTPFYFEYPALVTMLLREVAMGLSVGLLRVEVRPIDSSSRLLYRVGSDEDSLVVEVDRRLAPDEVSLRLPGSSDSAWPRTVEVHNLAANAEYALEQRNVSGGRAVARDAVRTDARGTLRFDATFSSQISFVARRVTV